MSWERFFLLVPLIAVIMAWAWLCWAILPAGLAYVLGITMAAVLAWYGRSFHDEALRDARIRNGGWPI